MGHALYRLDKIKIAFENHCLINIKLFRLTFNYLKFHAIIYFLQCIQDYGSAINYDTKYSETVYKYFLKAFYGRTNKKKYESQILEYNIHHTNLITIQNAILIARVPVGSVKKKELVVDTPNVVMTRVCNATNVLLKYNWHLDPMDNETAVDLRLQSIKKYWRCAAQVADQLSLFPDFFCVLAMFVNKVHGNYNQMIQLDKRLRFRRDKDNKWVSSYFIKFYISVQC